MIPASDLTWPPLGVWDYLDNRALCRRVLSCGAARRGNHISWRLR